MKNAFEKRVTLKDKLEHWLLLSDWVKKTLMFRGRKNRQQESGETLSRTVFRRDLYFAVLVLFYLQGSSSDRRKRLHHYEHHDQQLKSVPNVT